MFSIDIKEATILATSIELVVTALAAVEAVEVVGAVEVITADGVAAAVLVVLVVPETAMLFTDLSILPQRTYCAGHSTKHMHKSCQANLT